MRLMITSAVLVAFCCALSLLAGCAGGARLGEGAKASTSLTDTAQLIRTGQDRVDDTMGALSDLLAMQDASSLEPLYKSFVSSMDRLEKIAHRVGATNEAMREAGEDYFTAWDEQLAQITNEDIRARGAARMEQVRNSYGEIKQSYDAMTEQYSLLIADLRDIRVALGADLTGAGVDAVATAIDKAKTRANRLLAAAEQAAGAYEELGVSLSSSMR